MTDSLRHSLPAYPYSGDVVISGVSARLPQSLDIDEFTKNLYDRKYMSTTTEKAGRYEEGGVEIVFL